MSESYRSILELKNQRRKQLNVQAARKFQKARVKQGLCMRCGIVREEPKYQNYNRCRGLRRKSNLEDDHGITTEEYTKMLEQQGEVCKICGGKEMAKNGRLHVDHCHNTGKIRGLLCKSCNMGIGSFHDSPETLRRAAQYLEENA